MTPGELENQRDRVKRRAAELPSLQKLLEHAREEHAHRVQAKGKTNFSWSLPKIPLVSVERQRGDWRYEQLNEDIKRCKRAASSVETAVKHADRALSVPDPTPLSIEFAARDLDAALEELDRANVP